ncbi:MAG: ATP-binding protein [Nitrososphaeraceae archaeon]
MKKDKIKIYNNSNDNTSNDIKFNKSKLSNLSFFDKIAIRMFCPEFQDMVFEKKSSLFDSIIGYENIKKILSNLLFSEYAVSLLLTGKPGCGKSLFLKEIEREFPDESYYIDASRATKAGIFKVLFDDNKNRIRFLLIDELDKLPKKDQDSLLTLIQDGKLVQTLKTDTRTKVYEHLSVICASNYKEDILEPLLNRFYVIGIRNYTHLEFRQIAKSLLIQRYNQSYELANYIIDRVWNDLKNPSIRDCERIAKLSNNSKEMVDLLIENTSSSNFID